MTAVYSIGATLMIFAAVVGMIVGWDEIVDIMAGWKIRGHRKQHDAERTVQLQAQAARARARVPRQRGARHRRQ